jgi:hypothetical protein
MLPPLAGRRCWRAGLRRLLLLLRQLLLGSARAGASLARGGRRGLGLRPAARLPGRPGGRGRCWRAAGAGGGRRGRVGGLRACSLQRWLRLRRGGCLGGHAAPLALPGRGSGGGLALWLQPSVFHGTCGDVVSRRQKLLRCCCCCCWRRYAHAGPPPARACCAWSGSPWRGFLNCEAAPGDRERAAPPPAAPPPQRGTSRGPPPPPPPPRRRCSWQRAGWPSRPPRSARRCHRSWRRCTPRAAAASRPRAARGAAAVPSPWLFALPSAIELSAGPLSRVRMW